MSINSTSSPVDEESTRHAQQTFGRLFTDARRRALLRVLAAGGGVVELDRLTERVVDAEGGDESDPPDRFDRTLVSLYRCHLPALADAGLVELREDDGVFVDPDARALDDLL